MINVEANIDENKRIMKGTEHAILNKNTNKIGGSFELSKSASFIEKRAKIFDKYYEIQNNFISKINKTPIKITLIDGKVVEGKDIIDRVHKETSSGQGKPKVAVKIENCGAW